ncbi:hypothetical protein HY250_01495 [Candidatus Azambacteria bacterium]|nr:hypothetical protein [Candidatus Azambacteria bacterium]MBI3685054.1 hypothetical protein [Candidatus Azambacteria bacterium]
MPKEHYEEPSPIEPRRIFEMCDVLQDAKESKKKIRITLKIKDGETRSLEGIVDSLGSYSKKGGIPKMEITIGGHRSTGATVSITESDSGRHNYVPVRGIESIELVED